MKVVVIGGTGLIGTKVVRILRNQDHEVIAASASKGINSVTGEGLAAAFVDAQVVVAGDSPRLGPTRFPDWLSRNARKEG